MLDLVHSLVHREQGAEGEEHHGYDEGPEVPLAAVAELVLLGCFALRPTAAQKQQRLVPGVRHRMDRLGQHR